MKKFKGIIIFLFSMLGTFNVSADVATEQLRSTVNQAIAVLEDPEYKSEEKKAEKKIKMSRILGKRFDFEEMSKRALGREWTKLNQNDRTEFVALFRDLLENTYLDYIDDYSGERIDFLDKRLLAPNKIVVNTKFLVSDKEIPVDYNLMKNGEQWLIYDVIIEGVGLIKNYRTQFRKILRKQSYDALVNELRDKVDSLGKT